MATVDSNDDGIDRWVVRHFRFDPDRNERRHVPEIAFDDAREMEEFVLRAASELHERQQRHEVDEREQYSGVHWEPGHRDRMAEQRSARMAERRRLHGPEDG